MKEKILEDLSKILGVNILDATAYRKGRKKYYHWTISVGTQIVRLSSHQLCVQKAFRSAFLNQALLLPKRVNKITWDEVLQKFIAIVNK